MKSVQMAVVLQDTAIVLLGVVLYLFFMRGYISQTGLLHSSSSLSSSSSSPLSSPLSSSSSRTVEMDKELSSFAQTISTLKSMLNEGETVAALEELERSVFQRQRNLNRKKSQVEFLQSLSELRANGTFQSHHLDVLQEDIRRLETEIFEMVAKKRLNQHSVFRYELAFPIRTKLHRLLSNQTVSFVEHKPDEEKGEQQVDYVIRQYGELPLCLPFASLKLAVGIAIVISTDEAADNKNGNTSSHVQQLLKRRLQHVSTILSQQTTKDWTAYVIVFISDRQTLSFVLDDVSLNKTIGQIFTKDDHDLNKIRAKTLDTFVDHLGSDGKYSKGDGWAMAMSTAMDWAQEELCDVFIVLEEDPNPQGWQWPSDHLEFITSSYFDYPDAGLLYTSAVSFLFF
eukprot:TRINITY_DN2242_c0_g1_i1.p1 TRINITY_DN2242_c0_g1~~TRINITY_DN2242_c0_g1_i1.p1  ORF type:complete len:398 (-),score=72.88 TRINITY_DN2242_c0_g1_i1:310-1503(-)